MKFLRNARAWLAVGFGAGLFAAQVWNVTAPRLEAQEKPVAEKQVAESIPAGETPWVGVGGCAAAACHGGEAGKQHGEYTTWISQDPHARAYSVLFNKASLEMARQLASGDATRETAPHEDKRCLACHAPTGPVTARSPQLAGDGVGCEACHGAAERWSTSHAAVNWKVLAPEQRAAKRQELGMIDTRDPLIRAQQCTRCHVGHGDADVTHDLIAAGHPRLSFELGAFHAKLPKHWDNMQERRDDPAFEAKLWAVGQATSAAAHYELIVARADRKSGMEFANYDCYACHHALRAPSWRQAADLHGSRHGKLRPLSWYGPLDVFALQREIDEFPRLPASPHTIPDGGLTLERIRTAQHSRDFANSLRDWATQLNADGVWDANSVDVLERSLVAVRPLEPDWDSATQWYLALVALERARLDFQGDEPSSPRDEQVQEELTTLKKLLDFPANGDGPRVNSPRDYDPATFLTAAERLKQFIEARTPPREDSP